ncbi:MAG: methyltransferase type 11 [Porticoccaceae bacterium]|nr:MAG: methyltransferase type 11 [Porticoccaceae bacterium]
MNFDKNVTIKFSDDAFRRMDEAPDEKFYAIPRFTSHIDFGAIESVTELYRKYLPENSYILDLMSSFLSHFPADKCYSHVVGLGMNEREMANNKQLDEWVVHDLNDQPKLPFKNNFFDAGTICVSIDYLTDPVAVIKNMGRVLKKDAPLIITYSNRYFESKATAAWLSLSDEQRAYLIKSFLEETQCFGDIELMDCSPEMGDPLYAVIAKAI